jgi:iturin family lipopeptide synthetase A
MRMIELNAEKFWKRKIGSLAEFATLNHEANPELAGRALLRKELDDDLSKEIAALSPIDRFVYFGTILQALMAIFSSKNRTILKVAEFGSSRFESARTFFFTSRIEPGDTLLESLNTGKAGFLEDLKHLEFDCKFILEDALSANLELYNQLQHVGFCDCLSQNRFVIEDCDLSVFMDTSNTKEVIIFEYNRSMNADYVLTIFECFLNLIKSGRNCYSIKWKDMDLLNDSQKQEILKLSKGPTAPLAKNTFYIDLFIENSRKFCDCNAVLFQGRNVTYQELHKQSDFLAYHLKQKFEINRPPHIGLCMKRSDRWVVCILAIWKLGAIYIPLDQNYPRARLEFIIADANIDYLLTDDIASDLLFSKYLLSTPFIDVTPIKYRSSLDMDSFSDSNERSSIAYILYTSGSSGKPKGVLVEQVGMLNHLYAKVSDLGLKEKSRVIQNASQNFDISIWQIFSALLVGGTIVIIDDDTIKLPYRFLDTVNAADAEILEVVPSYLSMLLNIFEEQKFVWSNLICLIVTGETLHPKWVRQWFKLFPEIKLINAYGPTEASDDITHFKMDKAPDTDSIPIGRPIQNMNVYIANESLKLCPIGVQGEICVSGVGVGLGYLKNADLNKSAFLNDPFAIDTDFKMFRTGDLGKLNFDGNFEFLGRKDFQVKIRGNRIELGEVEKIILQLKNIKEAAVIRKQDQHGNDDLSCYVTTYYDSATTTDAVRSFLVNNLPPYMVPTYIQILESMPLTNNGKVDRNRLMSIVENIESVNNSNISTSLTSVEKKVLLIWNEALSGVSDDPNENFFRVGGNSLKAILMLSHIQKDFNVELDVTEVFSNLTVKNLARMIGERKSSIFKGIRKAEYQDQYKLSPGQLSIWILCQLTGMNIKYNMSNVLILEGILNTDALREAFAGVILRHEALRTIFFVKDGVPYQQIRTFDEIDFELITVDLSDEANKEEVAKRIIDQEVSTEFNLEKDLLMRVRLMRMDNRKQYLAFNMHHIIGDGWSLKIIMNEVITLYNSIVRDEPDPLMPLRIQYKDFSEWLQTKVTDDKEAGVFWHSEFRLPFRKLDMSVIQLPESERSIEGIFTCDLGAQLTGELKNLASMSESSVFIIGLVAVNMLVYYYSGQNDITLGTALSGRDHPDLRNQVGYYVNTVPIRSNLSPEMTFKQVLQMTKLKFFNILKYQLYPIEKMIRNLGSKGMNDKGPFFNTIVQMLDYEIADLPELHNMEGISLTHKELTEAKSKFDLVINFRYSGDRIFIDFIYKGLYNEQIVAKLAKKLTLIFNKIILNINFSVNEICDDLQGIPSFQRNRFF